MIRLLLTFVALVALHPAARTPRQPSAVRHQPSALLAVSPAGLPSAWQQRSVAAAGVLPSTVGLAAPSWVAAATARLDSHRAVTQLWLRGARLLC